MSKIKELEKILRTDVLIEVNNEITAIKKLMTKQKNNSELQDELVYMEDVKKYYDQSTNNNVYKSFFLTSGVEIAFFIVLNN